MRSSWSALHFSLVSMLYRQRAERAFVEMRATAPVLRQFSSIGDLVAHQHQAGGDPAAKNEVLRALVTIVRKPRQGAATAQILLTVVLWPGLDAVHFRLCRRFPEAREDHGGDLLSELALAVPKLEADGAYRYAATLIGNVERDLIRKQVRERCWALEVHPLDHATAAAASRFAAAQASRVPALDVALIASALCTADAQMLTRMIQFGETQEEAGAAMGLGPAASRKRYQRAIAVLKRAPNISLEAMSRFPAAVGF